VKADMEFEMVFWILGLETNFIPKFCCFCGS